MVSSCIIPGGRFFIVVVVVDDSSIPGGKSVDTFVLDEGTTNTGTETRFRASFSFFDDILFCSIFRPGGRKSGDWNDDDDGDDDGSRPGGKEEEIDILW